MKNAIAFANNDVITIAWSYGKRPDGCMGFAVYRIDDKGKETPLPSHAVFKGYKIQKGQTTEDFPIQKFYWKDPYARLVAEKTGNRTFRYKVVPLEGTPGNLTPMAALPFLTSNEVTISSTLEAGLDAFFNRGLISTQRVSRAFKGSPSKTGLLPQISDPKNKLRESLSSDMVEALTGFVDRARNSGTIYAALYELGDEELIQKLEGLGKRLQIILSNSVQTEDSDEINPKTGKPKQIKVDGNADSRARVKKTAKLVLDRIMPSNHIGHNKFLVYADAQGPKAVLLGSTNWTSTGLCAQTNNTIVLEDRDVAKRYLAYWNKLAADTRAAKGTAKLLQATGLRTWDKSGKDFTVSAGTKLQSWFSPNTPKARSSKSKNEARPVDMQAVCDRINKAKHAILFLAFYPGSPSIANWSALALKANKKLFVRGCVTNKSASEGFYYELKGMAPPKKVKGQKTPIKQDPRVIGAEAFDGKIIPEGWQKEILKAGFAIIHDKVMVIDPFSNDCAVVTGSHNLGHKASYDNDENLVIIEGNKKLAVAYATHVLDVYDHFAWRYLVKRDGKKADQGLKSTPDEWLNQYFDANGDIKVAQLRFWLEATA
ncbi:MAG TPA: phospholipase D-like domain-containing protein [Thermoanaerobaculia bacterium]|nr:phospholipase D-like domain-containing protein [Thermoanaerobaculia bacterium]